ncbi:MAG TPA: hypothetical protein VFK06_25230 [Candidatus Angelobacter sp.]|nr:hypothetical protein [Candidatus Angelobacter sp.]
MNNTKPANAQLVSLVWLHGPSRYSGSDLVVLLKLAGLQKQQDGDVRAFSGVDYLSRYCGLKSRRGMQKILKRLKHDGVLKIKYRAGHSSFFYIDAEALRKIPLVNPGDPSDDAVGIAGALFRAITNEVPSAVVPADWAEEWPLAMQEILDRGHATDTIIKTARYALDNEPYRSEIILTGAVALAEVFEHAKISMDGGRNDGI